MSWVTLRLRTTTRATIGALALSLLALGLTACGDDASSARAADPPVATASTAATADPPSSPSAASGGVTCGRLGVGNYVVNFLECTDQERRVLFCKQSGASDYECSCQMGGLGEERILDTVLIENRKPFVFEREDVQALHANATAAAHDICGFKINHYCDGTS